MSPNTSICSDIAAQDSPIVSELVIIPHVLPSSDVKMEKSSVPTVCEQKSALSTLIDDINGSSAEQESNPIISMTNDVTMDKIIVPNVGEPKLVLSTLNDDNSPAVEPEANPSNFMRTDVTISVPTVSEQKAALLTLRDDKEPSDEQETNPTNVMTEATSLSPQRVSKNSVPNHGTMERPKRSAESSNEVDGSAATDTSDGQSLDLEVGKFDITIFIT